MVFPTHRPDPPRNGAAASASASGDARTGAAAAGGTGAGTSSSQVGEAPEASLPSCNTASTGGSSTGGRLSTASGSTQQAGGAPDQTTAMPIPLSLPAAVPQLSSASTITMVAAQLIERLPSVSSSHPTAVNCNGASSSAGAVDASCAGGSLAGGSRAQAACSSSASGSGASGSANGSTAAEQAPSWRQRFVTQHSYVTQRVCPRCGDSPLLPVVYGFPSAPLMQVRQLASEAFQHVAAIYLRL